MCAMRELMLKRLMSYRSLGLRTILHAFASTHIHTHTHMHMAHHVQGVPRRFSPCLWFFCLKRICPFIAYHRVNSMSRGDHTNLAAPCMVDWMDGVYTFVAFPRTSKLSSIHCAHWNDCFFLCVNYKCHTFAADYLNAGHRILCAHSLGRHWIFSICRHIHGISIYNGHGKFDQKRFA